MKIFILFALASVSVCFDYGGTDQALIMCGPGGYSSLGQGGSGQGGGGSTGQGGSWQSGQGGGGFSGHGGSWSSSGQGGQSTGQGGGGSSGHEGSWSSSGQGGQSTGQGGGGSSGHSGSWSTWSSWSTSSSSTFQCDSTYKNDFANDRKCLKHALKNAPGLLKAAEQLICKHRNRKDDKTDEYFKELKSEFEIFVGCTSCGIGYVIGLQEPLGEVGATLGNTTSDIFKALENIGQTAGLSNPVLDIICRMLSPLFASECAKKLIGDDVSKVTDNVKAMLCKKEEDLDVALTMTTLKNGGCVGDNLVGTDKVLENITGEVGEVLGHAVKNAVKSLKTTPIIGGLLKGILCTVVNIVNGIVNGGNGDGGLLTGLLGRGNGGGGNGGGGNGGGGNGGRGSGLLGGLFGGRR